MRLHFVDMFSLILCQLFSAFLSSNRQFCEELVCFMYSIFYRVASADGGIGDDTQNCRVSSHFFHQQNELMAKNFIRIVLDILKFIAILILKGHMTI